MNERFSPSLYRQKALESQSSLFVISADTSIQNDTVHESIKLDAATSTIGAGIEGYVEHYGLKFIVPLVELVAVEARDLSVTQNQSLVQSRLEALLSV